MTFIEKFEEIKKKIGTPDLSKLTESFAVQVNMTDADCGGAFYIAYIGGNLAIEPYDYHDHTAMIYAKSKDLIDALPLTNYCTTVPLALLNGQSAATRIGIVAPVEFTHVIHADFSQMRMSAGPQAVKIIFDLCPPEKTSLQPAIDLTRAFMQAHRLKPVCEGYTRQYAWFVDPDGQMRHYSELIVPVTAE